MPLRLYNTLTQKSEPFEPREPGKVGVYLCGLTTYDLAHAGHARTNTTFDVLVRHLRARGFKVNYVRNVTDVDDKILRRAQELGQEPLSFSAEMAKLADADLKALGCATPTHEPRVSNHLGEIIALIKTLIDKGYAYVERATKGHDVYFSVRSFHDYGKLSHRKIDDLLSGARVEVGEIKRDPLDFALWKGCEADAWGWSSPWGQGRPGWHIECSAMAGKYLGEHFDIHCGGMDLIFPHHENEIAQSEAAWGAPFATTWLHGGFVTADNEKMSKSLGNFVTIRDVLNRNDAEAFRYFLLGTHYRGPLSFDVEKHDDGRVVFPGVDEAERRMDYLYGTREGLVALAAGAEPAFGNVLQGQAKIIESAPAKLLSALDKDLNTPGALAVLAEMAKAANEVCAQGPRLKKDKAVFDAARQLAAEAVLSLDGCCAPLGLMHTKAEDYAARTRARRLRIRGLDEKAVEATIFERKAARASKDFARADTLRAELGTIGIELFDSGEETLWKVIV